MTETADPDTALPTQDGALPTQDGASRDQGNANQGKQTNPSDQRSSQS